MGKPPYLFIFISFLILGEVWGTSPWLGNSPICMLIDLEENKIICDIKGQHANNVICIKKIYHPFYGESLLSAADDNTIKLWSI